MVSALLFLTTVALALSYPLAVPTAEQLAWNELEMGCLIHFNMYLLVVIASIIHLSSVRQTFVPNISYTYIPGAQAFTPTNLSTDNWIEACAKFGGKVRYSPWRSVPFAHCYSVRRLGGKAQRWLHALAFELIQAVGQALHGNG